MASKNNTTSLVSNLGLGMNKGQSQTTEKEGRGATERAYVESGCKAGEARTTIILSKDLMKKIKFIALAEGCSIKEKVTEGLKAVVDEWEAKNGQVPVD